jgi:hypothetical protein
MILSRAEASKPEELESLSRRSGPKNMNKIFLKNLKIYPVYRVVDPDSMTCVDPDLDLESGSMGKKNEEKMHFSFTF